ncbi:MAG TPA: PAS domain S-box protein [Thermoanaerobaculia bacterium]|nr:PAS domain S-box protein [Thermoanaerobaculia bacterium]
MTISTSPNRSDGVDRLPEERWKAVFDNPHTGVAIVGLDGRFVETNARFQSLVGYSADELRQMSVLEITHPDDLALHSKSAEAIRSGSRPDVQLEKRYLRKGGGVVWVRVTALRVPAPSGASGEAIELVEDATERRAIVERLNQQERQTFDAETVAHFGTWEWDPVSEVAVWSDGLCRLLGVDPIQIRPSLASYLERVFPADLPLVRSSIESAFRGRTNIDFDNRIVRPDGDIRTLRNVGALTVDPSGAVTRVIGVTQDITERKAAEERLEQQDRLFREAQRIAHFGTWEWDPVADAGSWSEGLCRIAGVESGFRPNLENALDHVAPEEREHNRRAIDSAMADRGKIEFDTQVVRPDGSRRVIHVSGAIVFDESGAVARLAGVTQDITERRRAELEALEKERWLGLAFDQITGVVWTTDRELRVTSAHGAVRQVVAKDPKDVVGNPVVDYLSGPDGPGFAAHLRALAGEHAEHETIRNGRTFQVHVDPLRDEAGKVVGVIGIALDISAQRRAEERLRESDSRYRLLFEINPSPMWVYDEETFRFLAVNDAAIRHYGYSREEFLSMRATEIRPPEEVPRWLEYFRTRTDLYAGGVWRHRKKDGTEILVEAMARSLDFAGRPARLTLVRDVTDRRRAEERLARSAREMKALWARLQTIREEEDARVAREVHDEIGQTLTALGLDVAWLSRNLNRRQGRAKFADKLKTMAELIEQATGAVVRIAADLRPGALDELGLEAAAEWAVREFGERTGVECGFSSNWNGDPPAREHATAIFRILQEALTNVARHARAGHVEVRLSGDGEALRLEVRDDGVGIDAGRVADSRSLGLLGMLERARAFGGDCVSVTHPDGGTMVTATIPRRTAPGGPGDRNGEQRDATNSRR